MGEYPATAVRRAVNPTGFSLLVLSYQTLGIIYSDIGTSPLYVLNGIWSPTGPVPSEEDVIGGLSCIIWSITLLPLLKYVFVALRFGSTEGEGGCFALFHGLFPPSHASTEDDRTLTGDSTFKPPSISKLLRFKWVILIWALFGTSLTMADGVFTPAVSVTSAVGGIAVAVPSVENKVIPISIGFLVALFIAQRLGTTKLAVAFSPITFVWLSLIGATGIVNILKAPVIFRAFDPSRAVLLFVRTKNYDILSGVLLAVTGCEALFANLGQFSMLSIQLSFGCFTYPALILAYLGQGARLIHDGQGVIANVFYRSIPGSSNGPLFWIVYVFAILATLVASQAMITATFSLLQQLINMKSFPPLRMVHTSEKIQGQIYISVANWALGIATVVVVAAFKSSLALTNAYGFCVASVMFVTSTLMAVQCFYVKHLPVVLCVMFFLFFGFLDGLFWGASLRKIPHGAWVPLMIGVFLLATMIFWSWAKGLEDTFDGANRKNLRHIIHQSANDEIKVEANAEPVPGNDSLDVQTEELETSERPSTHDTEKKTLCIAAEDEASSKELTVLPILGIFHKFASGRGVPHSFAGFLRLYPALPRVCVFLSVRILPLARIPREDKFIVNKVRSIDGFYGVTYQIGFREGFHIDIPTIVEEICKLERQAHGINPDDSNYVIREIVDAAKGATHIVPHYNVVSRPVNVQGIFRFMNPVFNWVRSGLIEGIYRRLATMFPETANWLTAAEDIIHVGVTARI